jgi:hypothetical protein
MQLSTTTRHGRAVLAFVLISTVVVPLAATTGASVSPPPAPKGVGLFCPCWGDVPKTDAAWDQAARNHAVIAAGANKLTAARVARLHQANPKVLVLAYTAGPYLPKGSSTFSAVQSQHPDYFARDARGNLITVPLFPKLHLMDQGNPGWRAMQATQAQAAAAKVGADGVYVDSMGPAAVGAGYTSSRPVSRGNHQPYSAEEWLRYSVLTLNAVKARMGSGYVMFNGLIDGTEYRQDSHILATSDADGGMAEAFVRQAMSGINSYPSANAVQDELDMMADMDAKGKAFFGWTKTWAPSSTAQQREAWNRFALAIYLLGKGKESYYNFLPSRVVDRTSIFYANEQAAIGTPIGSYKVVGNSFVRLFTNGVVTVNPVTNDATIELKKS